MLTQEWCVLTNFTRRFAKFRYDSRHADWRAVTKPAVKNHLARVEMWIVGNILNIVDASCGNVIVVHNIHNVG